ncbi:ATP-binding protein [Streptomyces sp. TG1A-8]|uniref:ATP-binding protein n=1 Tax=Streptomyces sp. TG1A-8 TaxID=3051385 RepID=UPI00265BFA4D|nr:ATP-binding protein [Streptomyces sp. TG1A-8]MDO0926542.1 ATP-binding protein [Streptomyces sp. TG1A-8]
MPTPQTQVTVTVRTFAQRFSSTRRGARLARRLAAHRLEAWGVPYGSAASDTLLLIVAELAANAVRHGRVPGRDFALRLVHRPAAALIRVEVSDTHPALPVCLAPAPADADGGRGLLLVDALASRWGVTERTGPGKTVWAELDLAAGTRAGHST